MTQDEIIEMVREADLDWHKGWALDDDQPNRFEIFAKLVEERTAAKEREACIHVCREIYSAWMCETDEDVDAPDPNDCIRAIRARG